MRVEGGAQDGVGKAMLGGTIAILKGKGAKGKRLNGSVGKSFAYGAQRGRSTSRARPTRASASASPAPTSCSAASRKTTIDDARGCIVDRANAKGFAFEYMTSGRAIVLGDLGPWACAGMTGGRVYVRLNAFGIDRGGDRTAARRGRQGRAQGPRLRGPDRHRRPALPATPSELRATGQDEEAERILGLAADATSNFLMVVPHKVQADPSISTE